MRSLTFAVALLAQACCVAGASFCDEGGFQTVWGDEFDGPELNTSVWSTPTESNGGYCRSAYCDANNVHVEDGKLVLTSLRNASFPGFEITTGVVISRDKQVFNATPEDGPYRICVSAMLPGWVENPNNESQGYWPAHWMMPNDQSCWPDHGEMDILEMINGNAVAATTYHWSDVYPNKTCTQQDSSWHGSKTLPADWNTTYHEFSLERGVGYVAFAVDGVVTFNTSTSAPPPANPAAQFVETPFYLILQTAIGGPWPGNSTDQTVFPGYHRVDWVHAARRLGK
ncbi:Beta-glucanase [Diplonema papillatum]|nr:Beta-glucanase [Diplonema papillatum]|eukprot:gene3741-5826_t